MRVYLMRHASAEEAGPSGDASRPLTERGRREAREAGEALRGRGATPALVLSSPRLRARETAEIVAKILGVKAEVRESLDCGAPAAAYDALRDQDVLIVGHNPEISAVAGTPFRPSSIVCFEDSRLVWVRHPNQETQ